MSIPVPNIPRYTSTPLPQRRFLPGDAHAADIPARRDPPKLTSPEKWRECAAYLYGCDLYNHGFWWESHEVWEDLWHQAAKLPEPRVQHAFLQSLIQTAACAIKLEQRKDRGLRMLLATSDRHLQRVIDHAGNESFMGLPLRTWREHVQQYYRSASTHDDRFPLIRLQP